MNILMLTDRMGIGGAETHVYTLAKALQEGGHRVTLLSAGGCFAERLGAMGIRTEYMPSDRRTLFSVFRSVRCVGRLCATEDFDVIHAHTRFTAVLAKEAGDGIPTVVTAHLPFPASPLERRIAYWGRETLAVSEDIRDSLCRIYGVLPERISQTVNGVDTAVFRPIPHGDSIVHVSRFDSDRSATALALCRTAPRLLKAFPKKRIFLAGDGTCMPVIRRAAKEANRALGRNGVVLLGAVTNAEEVLRLGNIFVGVSRAALEAMCTGMAVILSGDEGYGGICDGAKFSAAKATNFCERGRPHITDERLFCDLCRLLSEGTYRDKTGAAVGALARDEYGAGHMAEDAVAAYRRACAPKNAFVIGYYGHGNFGDEATLSQLKSQLMQRNIYKIRILSKKSDACRGFVSKNNLFAVRRFLKHSDAVIFGGGNLLQSETSFRSLLYYAMLLHFCVRQKRRVYMVDVGVGALSGRLSEAIVRRALRSAKKIFFRTSGDYEEGLRLTKTDKRKQRLPEMYLSADICFSLPLFQRNVFLPEKESCGAPLCLFALHGSDDACISLWIKTIRQVVSLGYAIGFLVLFPTQDMPTTRQVATATAAPLYCVSGEEEFREYAATADVVVSERLHGAVFSLLCSVPCLLSETLKSKRLYNDVCRTAEEVGTPCPLALYGDAKDIPYLLLSSPAFACPVLKKSEQTAHPDFTRILSALKLRSDLSQNMFP